MVQRYHEDVLEPTIAERDRLNEVINEIRWLQKVEGQDLTPEGKATRVASIKAKAGRVAMGYQGNPRPAPPAV